MPHDDVSLLILYTSTFFFIIISLSLSLSLGGNYEAFNAAGTLVVRLSFPNKTRWTDTEWSCLSSFFHFSAFLNVAVRRLFGSSRTPLFLACFLLSLFFPALMMELNLQALDLVEEFVPLSFVLVTGDASWRLMLQPTTYLVGR